LDGALKSALIGLAGVVLGFVIRDALLPVYFFRRKRETELEDQFRKRRDELENQYRNELIQARDVVRLYADPLLQSCTSLNFRLKEVLEQKGRATFLLPQTPQSEFVIYKRISTLYRLAALLAWIRAYRIERSYLDPNDVGGRPSEIERVVQDIESALADGPRVETQRLNELLRIWVPSCPTVSEHGGRDLAIAIDNVLRSILTQEKKTHALELTDDGKGQLCSEAAEIISHGLSVNIPPQLITGELSRAIVFFGIKEAYVYRDWQQAIGDLLLTKLTGTPRRFDVMGYAQFESLFLGSDVARETERRWIRRLDAVFAGLEPDKEDVFDARRDQLKRIRQASERLQRVLEEKIEQYARLTAQALARK
jgi:hypothetical protein